MNLTTVAYSGSYGTYEINADSLKMTIDPKVGTTHTTALTITGNIEIKFTPNSVAPQEIKDNGVASTFKFSLDGNWTYEGKKMVSLAHDEAETIDWGEPGEDGVFTYTITAEELAQHILLTEIVLDTKAKYDQYNAALGQIVIAVSDGQTSTAE